MRSIAFLALAAFALSACRDDRANLPMPVEISADSLGYYCQMQLLEHDGPKGQIHLDGMPAPIFFAQVRDTIAYLHMPEQSHAIRAAYVQDMADPASWAQPGDWIAADQAVYVIESDRTGGMGATEFVPFSDVAAARSFIVNHGGTLRRFAEISAANVLTEDTTETAPDADIAARLRVLSQKNGSP